MVYISVIIFTHITNYNLSHVGPLWAAFMYCIYTCLSDLWVLVMLMYQSANAESRLYAVFKFEFNQLLNFIEKFSPLSGFVPRASPVPSRYATNWAILAWIKEWCLRQSTPIVGKEFFKYCWHSKKVAVDKRLLFFEKGDGTLCWKA